MAIQMPPAPDVTQRVARLERELQALGGVALRERGWRSDHVGGRAVDPRFASRSDILRETGDFDLTVGWLPEHDYSPEEDRNIAIRTLRLNQGVVDFYSFLVSPTEPRGWNVRMGPGRAIVDGTESPWTQGSYVAYANDTRTIAVQPAHPTLDRWDIAGLQIYDQANSTVEGFGGAREILTGAPAANPVAPEIPANFMPIWLYRIPAGAANITDTVTDGSAGAAAGSGWIDLRRFAGAMSFYWVGWIGTISVPVNWTVFLDGPAINPNVPAQLRGLPYPTIAEVTVDGRFGGRTGQPTYHLRIEFYRGGVWVVVREPSNLQGSQNTWTPFSFVAAAAYPAGEPVHYRLSHQYGYNQPDVNCQITTRVFARPTGSFLGVPGSDYDWQATAP